ncbi:ABC transporter permease [Alkalihalobacillus sp. AL-G]|uniref:ABC transporter permease n=1 Tax=Alkalihalobacillus sp. AL-G TaxID=2926399 RepID=UPI00272B1F9D|nr:ABC transporter permease [Alkalihalobacillus sp. AL-G]WLD94400.1 ABC transporter permease [Alkalihalobacillus sp. AL-G]
MELPKSKVDTINLPSYAVEKEKRETPFSRFLRNFIQRRISIIGFFIVILIIIIAVCAPWLAPYDPLGQNLANRLQGPSSSHVLGTDDYGRDILSRIIYGARVSLIVSVIASGIGLLIGGFLGTISAYYGKFIDNSVMRVMDILLSFPTILLALLIMAFLGPSMTNIMIAIGITAIPEFARVGRSSVLALKESDYVLAEHAMGASDFRILFKHIIPNGLAPIIILFSLKMGTAILTEASLSFLGLGVDPSTPSWGGIIADGRNFLRDAPWISISGGIAVMIAVVGYNFIGDGLRDALDPKLNKER